MRAGQHPHLHPHVCRCRESDRLRQAKLLEGLSEQLITRRLPAKPRAMSASQQSFAKQVRCTQGTQQTCTALSRRCRRSCWAARASAKRGCSCVRRPTPRSTKSSCVCCGTAFWTVQLHRLRRQSCALASPPACIPPSCRCRSMPSLQKRLTAALLTSKRCAACLRVSLPVTVGASAYRSLLYALPSACTGTAPPCCVASHCCLLRHGSSMLCCIAGAGTDPPCCVASHGRHACRRSDRGNCERWRRSSE